MRARSAYTAALRASTSKLFSSNVPVVVVARGKSKESADAAAMTSKDDDDGEDDGNDEDDEDGGGLWRRIAEVGGEGRPSSEAAAGRQARRRQMRLREARWSAEEAQWRTRGLVRGRWGSTHS